jgi:hypothetical protein
MNSFFCAKAAGEAGEDLIGSASPCQTYILIECPLPWASSAFESKSIPQNLRDLIRSTKALDRSLRFLLVTRPAPSDRPHLLIYEQQPGLFSSGYRRWEGTVDHLDQVAPMIQSYLAGQLNLGISLNRDIRDLLVCVHGSHDKCCAKFGLPFYRDAIATVAQLGHSNVRLWQTSHFGGHRFAPTLIDLPAGRCYGRLDQAALQAILTRSGNVQEINSVYRGWSLLPQWLQPLERKLIEYHGWQWFDYKVCYRLVRKNANGQEFQAELSVEQTDGLIYHYEVEMMQSLETPVYVKNSCNSAEASVQVKYQVRSLKCQLQSFVKVG